MTTGGADNEVAQALLALWEQSRAANMALLETVDRAALAALEGGLPGELRRAAERDAHRLAGDVGMFGFVDGARLAREAERLLVGEDPLAPADLLRLSELAVGLRAELSRPAAAAPSPAGAADERPLLLIVDADAVMAGRLAAAAVGRGMRISVAATPAAAREAVAREAPAMILLDLDTGEPSDDGWALLAAWQQQEQRPPVLILTRDDVFTDRVEVARLGGRGFLVKTLPPDQLLDAAVALAPRQDVAGTVMAVDDDPLVLGVLQSLLEARGMKVITLANPAELWDTLERTAPDLLMLDIHMPNFDGITLCRAVRSDPRWLGLPILFLTAHTDAATVHRGFAAGADDFVAKPIVGPELITRVRNRLERARLLQRMAETDYLTGVANHSHSAALLERYLELAESQGEPLSLAMVDLDHLKAINDQHGHEAGDRVLRSIGQVLQQAFHGADVVGRWGGEDFAVGMYGMNRENAAERLAEVLESLRKRTFAGADGELFRITFSAGVAEFPADGTDLQALYRAADEAQRHAKAQGRDRILPAGWRPGGPRAAEQVDVAVVDADEAVAGLLLHALETRGLSARWFTDGLEAAEALAGARPRVRARVVLLDVDLPGLDGIGVLRRLTEQPARPLPRVIMLTFRSTEAEVLQALELEAFDHVAKPFSLPILLQRVRRALQA